MEFRQYLTNNANSIMKNSLTNANVNCATSFLQINSNYPLITPVLFNSTNDQPLPYNSDLKKSFLDYYIKISSLFSPGIMSNN